MFTESQDAALYDDTQEEEEREIALTQEDPSFLAAVDAAVHCHTSRMEHCHTNRESTRVPVVPSQGAPRFRYALWWLQLVQRWRCSARKPGRQAPDVVPTACRDVSEYVLEPGSVPAMEQTGTKRKLSCTQRIESFGDSSKRQAAKAVEPEDDQPTTHELYNSDADSELGDAEAAADASHDEIGSICGNEQQRVCSRCGQGDEFGLLMVCNGCGTAAHHHCSRGLSEMLLSEEWECDLCQRGRAHVMQNQGAHVASREGTSQTSGVDPFGHSSVVCLGQLLVCRCNDQSKGQGQAFRCKKCKRWHAAKKDCISSEREIPLVCLQEAQAQLTGPRKLQCSYCTTHNGGACHQCSHSGCSPIWEAKSGTGYQPTLFCGNHNREEMEKLAQASEQKDDLEFSQQQSQLMREPKSDSCPLESQGSQILAAAGAGVGLDTWGPPVSPAETVTCAKDVCHIDLCAGGLGGFTLAAKRCGMSTKYFAEIDDECREVFQATHPETRSIGRREGTNVDTGL